MAKNKIAGKGDNVVKANVAGLKDIVTRLERLDDERSGLTESMKEVYLEAKLKGFDAKPLRRLLSIRKKDQEKYQQETAIVMLYAEALGMGGVFA